MVVRVLIVDDSAFFRRRLTEIISADPRLAVVGEAENGQQAVEQVKQLHPDVVTMDLEMPVMDGIAAVKNMMAEHPVPIMMLSAWTTQGAQATLDALDAGAIDYLPKRLEDLSADRTHAHQQLCRRLLKVAQAKTVTATTPRPVAPPLPPETLHDTAIQHKSPVELVVIGSSTGGPVALQQILPALPADFPCPVLLIQHMPAHFTRTFAQRLDAQCQIQVRHAQHGEEIHAGTAYLAPGGTQLTLKKADHALLLNVMPDTQNHIYKPCLDITLSSIATVCPQTTLVIILTGMGSDGRKGCQQLKPLGATIWAQNEASSTIFGMPKAVIKAHLADKVLDIHHIGRQLTECTSAWTS